ncbi:MAG: hypothetical protein NC548_22920 [Lachnospiraceae bacterium]|nr:hypothetical protein [Lachnospiraceae bacterium]
MEEKVEKMTNKKALMWVLEKYPDMPSDVTEKLQNMLESLENKKRSTSKGEQEKRENAEKHREIVLNYLRESGEKLTCTEIGEAIPELKGKSNQYIASILKDYVAEGTILKVKEKGNQLYYVPTEE